MNLRQLGEPRAEPREERPVKGDARSAHFRELLAAEGCAQQTALGMRWKREQEVADFVRQNAANCAPHRRWDAPPQSDASPSDKRPDRRLINRDDWLGRTVAANTYGTQAISCLRRSADCSETKGYRQGNLDEMYRERNITRLEVIR